MNNNEIQILLKEISDLRKNHNLSKKEMSKKLGISIYMINEIERGVLPPQLTVDVLFRIHEHFNINPVQMLNGQSKK